MLRPFARNSQHHPTSAEPTTRELLRPFARGLSLTRKYETEIRFGSCANQAQSKLEPFEQLTLDNTKDTLEKESRQAYEKEENHESTNRPVRGRQSQRRK